METVIALLPSDPTLLEELPEIKQKKFIGLIPGTQVLLTHTTLPLSRRKRLEQAVPFAIEEQLSDKVESLHFAIGPQAADGEVPLAICKKELIQAWHEKFRSSEATSVILIPECLAMPIPQPGQIVVVISNQFAHCRTDLRAGFSIEVDALPQLLLWLLQKRPAEPPTHLRIYKLDDSELPPMDDLHCDISIEKFSGSLLEFYQQYVQEPYFNLLQNELRIGVKQNHNQTYWKASAAIALSALLFIGIGNVAQYIVLNRQHKQIQAEIEKIYMSLFPAAKSVISPRTRIESELLKYPQASGDNAFLRLLKIAGKSVHDTNGAKLKSIEYRNQQLHLQVEVQTLDDLDVISRKISESGVSVKRDQASKSGKKIEAQFILARNVA